MSKVFPKILSLMMPIQNKDKAAKLIKLRLGFLKSLFMFKFQVKAFNLEYQSKHYKASLNKFLHLK